jgi:hypothetical protein
MARDCKARPDNEFGFVRFFRRAASGNLETLVADPPSARYQREFVMFATARSPFTVLVPLALLLAVVIWTNRPTNAAASQQASQIEEPPALDRHQTVAANLPSR